MTKFSVEKYSTDGLPAGAQSPPDPDLPQPRANPVARQADDFQRPSQSARRRQNVVNNHDEPVIAAIGIGAHLGHR